MKIHVGPKKYERVKLSGKKYPFINVNARIQCLAQRSHRFIKKKTTTPVMCFPLVVYNKKLGWEKNDHM